MAIRGGGGTWILAGAGMTGRAGSVGVQANSRHAIPAEVREHMRAGLLAETRGEHRIVEEALDLRPQRRRIAWRDEHAGFAIYYQLRHPSDSRTDNRRGAGHCF